MTTVGQKIIAVCLSALILSGCAARGPIPPKLTTDATATSGTDAKADTGEADAGHSGKVKKGKKGKIDKDVPLGAALEYQTAVNDCGEQATKATQRSLLTIFTHLRPGAYTESYVACMKKKGYDVSQ